MLQCSICNAVVYFYYTHKFLLNLLFPLAGYVAEILANWFIASGLPLPTIVRLLGEQDKIRKRKALEAMEVDNDEAGVEENTSDSLQPVAEEVEELPDLKYADVNGRHQDRRFLCILLIIEYQV